MQVFSPQAGALAWDDKGEYTRERVSLYYCSNAGRLLKESQIVDVLQGKYPDKFEEEDPQVRLRLVVRKQ